MRRLTALCARGLLLASGRLQQDAPMPAVAAEYAGRAVPQTGAVDLTERRDRTGTGQARFERLELLSGDAPGYAFMLGEPFSLRIGVRVTEAVGTGLLSATVRAEDGTPVFCLMNDDAGCVWRAEVGAYEFTITLEHLFLYPGRYTVDLWLGDRNSYRIDYLTDAASFAVAQGLTCGISRELSGSNGLVFQPARWAYVSSEQPEDCSSSAVQASGWYGR
jgi:hypothetical protein